MVNSKILATLDTQDTGQINVGENRGGEQRYWRHWTHKTQDK